MSRVPILPGAVAEDALELGRTPETPRGYHVRLKRVVFPGAGQRLRLCLYQYDDFVRHLDLTPDLAADTGRLLRQVTR